MTLKSFCLLATASLVTYGLTFPLPTLAESQNPNEFWKDKHPNEEGWNAWVSLTENTKALMGGIDQEDTQYADRFERACQAQGNTVWVRWSNDEYRRKGGWDSVWYGCWKNGQDEFMNVEVFGRRNQRF